jgi:hypothetical protein
MARLRWEITPGKAKLAERTRPAYLTVTVEACVRKTTEPREWPTA